MAKKKREKEKGEWLTPFELDMRPMKEYADMFKDCTRKFSAIPKKYGDMFMHSTPDIDLIDTGDRYKIKVDLPGVKKEDVTLNATKGSVTISAKTMKQKEEKLKGYYYSERSASSYYRSVPLPSEIVPDSAKAKLEDGTLEVTVKKTKGTTGKSIKVE